MRIFRLGIQFLTARLQLMARKCKICKIPIPSASKSETIYHKLGFCGEEHTVQFGRDKARAARERLQRKSQSEARKAMAEERRAYNAAKRANRDNDRRYQWGLTVKAAQKLGRTLDKGRPCISCGRPDDGSVQFCGGHYRTKGAHPETALDIRNIMGQCNKRCNLELSGNIHGNKTTHGYRHGIIERYGQEYLEWLDGHHESPNYTCDDLKRMRAEFAAECRRLEAGLGPSKDWRKI